MTASWQSGHYADALQNAQALAAKGDANAEALLGRAYYEGVGGTRNYATAQAWPNKAVAQNNADAMFFLGLMYEYGRGVRQDVPGALGLFDKAAALGQRYAQMEAKGMRMEGAAAEQQARYAAACQSRGGIADGPLCLVGGAEIDPYQRLFKRWQRRLPRLLPQQIMLIQRKGRTQPVRLQSSFVCSREESAGLSVTTLSTTHATNALDGSPTAKGDSYESQTEFGPLAGYRFTGWVAFSLRDTRCRPRTVAACSAQRNQRSEFCAYRQSGQSRWRVRI